MIKSGNGHYDHNDYRSFGIPGQTFMDEPETKGTLLNNFTSKNDEVGFEEKKSLTIAKCEKILSEKYVQETAGTGGDSITSTLVDYPINPFYLPS